MSFDERPIINYLVRMVVPMRREFQRQLDVSKFLHEPEYAQEILTEALTSQDPRLKESASFVAERLRHAPGAAANPAIRTVPASSSRPAQDSALRPAARGDAPPRPTAPAQAQAPTPSAEPTSDEAVLLARLERYRKGLR